MSLKKIRLELGRTVQFPEGSPEYGYEFIAPLDETGHLDIENWKVFRDNCTVRRFWHGEDDVTGHLVHHPGNLWVFHYDDSDAPQDETIFRFDKHRFVEGDYVSITEHDDSERPFKIVRVDMA